MQKLSAKKIQSILVAAIMAVTVFATPAFGQGSPATYVKGGRNYVVTSATTAKKSIELVSLNARGKKLKKLNIGTKITATGENGGEYYVNSIARNAFKGAKATKVVLPSTLKKIKSGAFNGAKASKLTVVIKSKSLTKKAVKGCFKGAKAKVITVKVPKSKLKAYKKIFTKKNTGAKKIVVKAI